MTDENDILAGLVLFQNFLDRGSLFEDYRLIAKHFVEHTRIPIVCWLSHSAKFPNRRWSVLRPLKDPGYITREPESANRESRICMPIKYSECGASGNITRPKESNINSKLDGYVHMQRGP